MCLNDKVYFSNLSVAKLSIYTPATDSWDSIATPVSHFALTTYRSQLVLVGGINCDDANPSTKLWTLSEDGQWQETLPPMETACINASAVNHGDHLMVINGKEVNLYSGRCWAKAQCLPQALSSTKSIVLNDNLYVIAVEIPFNGQVYSASLDSLMIIASCQPSETRQRSPAWKKLPDVPDCRFYPAGFGRRLIVIALNQSEICTFSPFAQSWIRVGYYPYGPPVYGICAISLPSNELMVVQNRKVYKATIKSKCSEV